MNLCVCGHPEEYHDAGDPYNGWKACWCYADTGEHIETMIAQAKTLCGCKSFKLDNLSLVEMLAKERKLI